jgi:hypothetical protein
VTRESVYLIEILKEEARLRVAEKERIFGSEGHEQRLAEDICMRAAAEIERLAAIEEAA